MKGITEADISPSDSRPEGGLALIQVVYKEVVYIGSKLGLEE